MKSKAMEVIDKMFSEENAGTYLHPFWIWECNIGTVGEAGAKIVLSALESLPYTMKPDGIWETIDALREYIANGDHWIIDAMELNEIEIRDAITSHHAQLVAESLTIPMFDMA